MFTTVGRIVSIVSIAIGFAAVIGSFLVAPDMLSPEVDRISVKQSGLWLSQGATLVFCGLVLGVLCEISLKLEKSTCLESGEQ